MNGKFNWQIDSKLIRFSCLFISFYSLYLFITFVGDGINRNNCSIFNTGNSP